MSGAVDGNASRLAGALLVVLVAASALLAVARLDRFCLFEPDSADYLFTSRALATFDGYREIDHPDRPLHTFRPPGLPALLVPLSLARPFDVVAAKVVVLLFGVAALVLLSLLARRVAGPWAALAAVALTASSPYTLLHASEVVTEPPFMAGTFAVLWLIARHDDDGTRHATLLPAALLAALPFVRSIGVALTGAVVVWGLVARRRRRLALAAAVSLVPTMLWAWRNAAAGGPTYLGSIADTARTEGGSEVLARSGETLWFYLARLGDLALPGLGMEQPVYGRLLPGGAVTLGAPAWSTALIGAALLVAAAIGFRQRPRFGVPAGLYVGLTLAALAVYPPRHERLAWPIVPLLWLGAAIAAEAGVARRRAGGRRAAVAVVAVAVVTLAGWQSLVSARMVAVNLAWLGDEPGFHAAVAPPGYYTDWSGAGRLLAERAAPYDRVLTRHSDVGFTSHRWQDSIRFEEVSPAAWRGRVATLGARWLVVSTADCGRAFRWYELAGDPVYDYRVHRTGGDAAAIEILPDRAGAAVDDEQAESERLDACRMLVEAHPRREDARRELAESLAAVGRADEALEVLDAASSESAGLELSRARVLLEAERTAEAQRAIERARSADAAGELASAIVGVERRVSAAEALARRPPVEQARELAAEGRRRLELLDVRAGRRFVKRAATLAPDEPAVIAARAELAARTGDAATARTLWGALAAAGDREAAGRLRLAEAVDAVQRGSEPDPATLVAIVEALAGTGAPGRALDLLDRAVSAGADDPDVLRHLADLWLFYGEPERARELYQRVLARQAGDSAAAAGLARCRERLRVPAW